MTDPKLPPLVAALVEATARLTGEVYAWSAIYPHISTRNAALADEALSALREAAERGPDGYRCYSEGCAMCGVPHLLPYCDHAFPLWSFRAKEEA